MSAPFVSFQAVKRSVSIVQALEHYGLLDTLKRRGPDTLTGACPIHKGTNPTQFRVSLAKNCWNCFGGCKGGNVLDLVMAMEGVEVRQAALLLSGWFGVDSKTDQPSRADTAKRKTTKPEREEMDTATPQAGVTESAIADEVEETGENPPLRFAGLKDLNATHASLSKRGFSREVMEAFGVGYCRKGIMKEHIAIPIHNAKGELVAYAGRVTDDRTQGTQRYKYPETFHREWELFNGHRALKANKSHVRGLLLVEDFLDVFRLSQAGYDHAVALMGRHLSTQQHRLLREMIGRKSPLTILMEEGPGLPEILLALARDFPVRLIPCRPETLSVAQIQEILKKEE